MKMRAVPAVKETLRTAVSDLRSFPKWNQFGFCVLVTWGLIGIAWWVLPDFADLNRIPSLGQMLKIALVAFCFPAFIEEFVFRGMLDAQKTTFSMVVSTLLFLLWHPFAAYCFVPRALPMMLDPRFLAFVAVFGIAFCLMRRWTQSLWTPIFCHWLLTVTWKALGGAQFLTSS